jgi:hypothetical protein
MPLKGGWGGGVGSSDINLAVHGELEVTPGLNETEQRGATPSAFYDDYSRLLEIHAQ